MRSRLVISGGRVAVCCALYMATLAAIRKDGPIRRFYQHLKNNGKPSKLALTAAMRKLLIQLQAKLLGGFYQRIPSRKKQRHNTLTIRLAADRKERMIEKQGYCHSNIIFGPSRQVMGKVENTFRQASAQHGKGRIALRQCSGQIQSQLRAIIARERHDKNHGEKALRQVGKQAAKAA